MRVLVYFVLFLPGLTSLIGLILLLRQTRQSDTKRLLAVLATFTTCYYLCDVNFVYEGAYGPLLLASEIIGQFVAPIILSLVIVFFYWRYHMVRLPWYMYLWFIAPIVFGTVCIVFISLTGFEEQIRFRTMIDEMRMMPPEFADQPIFAMQETFIITPFNLVMFTYSLCALLYGVHVLRKTGFTHSEGKAFVWRGASMPPFHVVILAILQMLVVTSIRMSFGRYFLMDHVALNLLLSVLQLMSLVLVILSGLCIDYEECTLRQVLSAVFNRRMMDADDILLDMQPTEAETREYQQELEVEREVRAERLRLQSDVERQIREGLDQLMGEEKQFRTPGIKIEEVARMLCTNRLYLSHYINEVFGVSFTEYLTRLRIEYSKTYMLEHPRELQDTIAEQCGFVSAQAFSRKFREMEGVTPRMWMAQQKRIVVKS